MASLSTKERDRRQGQLRADMKRAGLDVLIVYGNSGRLGPRTGNLAYVSNFRPFSGQQAMVFPLEGEPVLLVGVDNQRIEALRTGWAADVRCSPLESVPEQVCGYMKKAIGAGKRIGISSLSIMPVAFYKLLQEQVPAKEWVEAGDLILERRYVQSEEEIALSRRAAGVADKMWEHLCRNAREGMSELDIRMELDRVMIPSGAWDNFNMVGLGNMADGGEAPWGYIIPPTERRVKRGDAVVLEISPRVDGYWNQIVRIFTLGPAAKWLVDAYDVARRARDAALAEMKPGGSMVGMVTAMQKVIEKGGYSLWPYGLVHITGLDLTDYMITPKSTGALKAGMVLTLHPMFSLGKDRQLFMGESYLVTGGGYEPLNRCSDQLVSL
ncbi:MAG: hypothetical protein A3J27_14140 [Candidatus Tectomicrobia bacterium RIFCSPLOWO2_12_FULL_69_37]|nr:MAG: hypothetical protein A3J27_14140 [Candidatus Tectomicrobia bacterium RIFCSPLOWO2_12_FULL_69_37]